MLILKRNFSIIYMDLIFTKKETGVWRCGGFLTKARRAAFPWVSDRLVESRGLARVQSISGCQGPHSLWPPTPALQAVLWRRKGSCCFVLGQQLGAFSQPASLPASCLLSFFFSTCKCWHTLLVTFQKELRVLLRLKKYVWIDIY